MFDIESMFRREVEDLLPAIEGELRSKAMVIKEKALVSLFKKFSNYGVKVGRLGNGDRLYSNSFVVVRGPVVPTFQLPDGWVAGIFDHIAGEMVEVKEDLGARFWGNLEGKEGKRLQVSNLLYERPGGSLSKPGTFYRQLDRSDAGPTYLDKSICDLFAVDLDQLREEYQFELLENRCVRIISKVYGVAAYAAPLNVGK